MSANKGVWPTNVSVVNERRCCQRTNVLSTSEGVDIERKCCKRKKVPSMDENAANERTWEGVVNDRNGCQQTKALSTKESVAIERRCCLSTKDRVVNERSCSCCFGTRTMFKAWRQGANKRGGALKFSPFALGWNRYRPWVRGMGPNTLQ